MIERLQITAVILLVLVATPLRAQDAAPATRTEALEQERREKIATLWPERENPLVKRVNNLVERGFREGLDSGKGSNGMQVVLGGTRSGHGMSAGVGYGRYDLWRERLGVRGTVRGTLQGAYLVDLDLAFQSFRTARSFVRLYSKYESSPQMDYYGQGTSSNRANRSSYQLSDFTTDIHVGIEPVRRLQLGLTGGYLNADTGPGHRDGVPSIEQVFNATTAPGLGEDSDFTRWGGFAVVDWRDAKSGPRRGGLLGVQLRRYLDVEQKAYTYRDTRFDAQYYIPYFNDTRVVALHAAATLTFHGDDQVVPYYLQPTLGGNDDLRGFSRYRFTDNNVIFMSAEHRWHVFNGLDMAMFVDAGKVAPTKDQLNFADLKYSGGLGLRVRFFDAIVSRIDFAVGPEQFRVMWTFSDINQVKW
jgi:outer membrane protein assembly factor BamA